MPIEGIPDSEKHLLCLRCRKWHNPDEGVLTTPEAAGPVSGMLQTAKAASGLAPEKRFICHRCRRIRRLTKGLIWGALAAVIVVVLLLDHFKVI